jgi:hypothetical protein
MFYAITPNLGDALILEKNDAYGILQGLEDFLLVIRIISERVILFVNQRHKCNFLI